MRNSENTTPASTPVHVCIICANGLGDALVQMVLANNLAQQGLRVTFFSNMAESLDEFTPAYSIERFPKYRGLLERLKGFDLCLYDSSGHYVRGMPTEVETWCKRNAVCYRMSDAPPRHTAITTKIIASRLPDYSPISSAQFKALNAALRGHFKGLYRTPVVEQLSEFLSERVGLDGIIRGNGLTTGLVKKNSKKIVIHPTSSNPKKNWPMDKYLSLIESLIAKGYQPSITVSPAERDHWLEAVNDRLKLRPGEMCEVPVFPSIAELADYYADALCFIGNDSGNAHLASCLGVPTLQLFSGWKKSPAWRAGWGNNKVITAGFPYNLIKKSWHKGVTVERVLREFAQFEAAHFDFSNQ